jgi:hypothetical protein
VTRADVPFIVAAVATGALLLYLGRSLTFWHDEWRSITFDGGFVDFFRPVNEHWSTFPLALYRATFELVELRSYLPYLAQVIVLHVVAVVGAYVLMRRRVGPFVATLLALPLLLLGAGAENLFWAFQTGFVGSVMFGVWALVFIERPGRAGAVVASALLIGSLMSSGIGLFFAVAAAGRTVLDRSYRTRALAVVPPLLAYVVWHFLAGRDALGTTGEIAGPSSVARFALRGTGYAVESMAGVVRLPTSGVLGLAVFAGLCAIAARRIVRGHPHGLAAGALMGVASMYVGIGAARADFEVDYARSSRYVYVAAFLLVLCIGDLLSARSGAGTSRPWRRVAAIAAVGAVLGWAISANAIMLSTTRDQFQSRADLTRAFIDLSIRHSGESWVDPRARLSSMPLIPPAGELPALVEHHGSPVDDSLVSSFARVPPPSAYQAALVSLVGAGFRVVPAAGGGRYASASIVEEVNVQRAGAGPCITVHAIRPDAALTLSVPGGTRVRASADAAVSGSVGLGRGGPPSRFRALDLTPGAPSDIVIPDIGDGSKWRVRFEFPAAGGRVRLCAVQVI